MVNYVQNSSFIIHHSSLLKDGCHHKICYFFFALFDEFAPLGGAHAQRHAQHGFAEEGEQADQADQEGAEEKDKEAEEEAEEDPAKALQQSVTKGK